MDQLEALQAEVIAVCKETWRNYDYRACVYIGTKYFVKYGTLRDIEPERATQEYIYDHAQ